MLCPAQLRKKPEVEPQIYATLFLQGILQVIPENKIQFRAFIGSLSTYPPAWLSFCLPACLLSAYHYPTIYLQHLIYIIDVAEQIVGIQRWIWHPLDVWHSSCLRSYCVTRMQVSLDMLNTVELIKLFINWIFRRQWYQYLLKLENGGFKQTQQDVLTNNHPLTYNCLTRFRYWKFYENSLIKKVSRQEAIQLKSTILFKLTQMLAIVTGMIMEKIVHQNKLFPSSQGDLL